MKKQLLFIPFLALLGTSCSGGHITTTPVIRNAPSGIILNAPKRQAVTEIPTNSTKAVNLGDLTWRRMTLSHLNYYYFVADLPTAYPAVSGKPYLIDIFNNKGWGYVENLTNDNEFLIGTATSRLLVRADEITSEASFKSWVSGKYIYYQTSTTPLNIYTDTYNNGYRTGYGTGYEEGEADGYNSESNKLLPNGMYTGLTIFPRRNYLRKLATRVVSHLETPENGQFYLIDTNANYTIDIKWTFSSDLKTIFQTAGNTIIGELYWSDIISNNWSTSWFYLYDKENHYFAQPKTYATEAPIDTSFYPEVYLGSTFTGGDPNIYFSGGGNAYQMGFADGQTYTIHASETYNNVFTIFTPAFRAVADFFNLNIGPFKVWYFFAIPLIVTLLILVLRLVKH